MRISATQCEALRLYRAEDWATLEGLEATIRGDVPENDDMIRGRALQDVLADPLRYRVELPPDPDAGIVVVYEYGDWRFREHEIDRLRRQIGADVWESKIEIPVGDHVLVCKADALVGSEVWEVKAPRSSFAAERYFESFQWRLYAWAFEADAVTYLAVKLGERRDRMGCAPVLWSEALTLYPYEGLEADCVGAVEAVAEFARDRGLEEYLQPREAAS